MQVLADIHITLIAPDQLGIRAEGPLVGDKNAVLELLREAISQIKARAVPRPAGVGAGGIALAAGPLLKGGKG